MVQPAQQPSGIIKFDQVNIIGGKPIGAVNIEDFITSTEFRPKILNMPVTEGVFNLVISGMKMIIVKQSSLSMIKRLCARKYTHILIGIGFDTHKPNAMCEFVEYFVSDQKDRFFKDNILIELKEGDFVIKIGDIISIKNNEKNQVKK